MPIAGIAGDQQAALFGQTCFSPGEAKNTYGTGCFLLMNTGDTPCVSRNGLVTTIAAGVGDRVAVCPGRAPSLWAGAVIQWLRDELRFFTESRDAEYYAQKVTDNGGVYLVPAFTGLGAPPLGHVRPGGHLRADPGHQAGAHHPGRPGVHRLAGLRPAEAMEADTGLALQSLKADGGASRDTFLMQFQADLLDCEVRRPAIRETTALGAAYLAGLATGVWRSLEEVRRLWPATPSIRPGWTAKSGKPSPPTGTGRCSRSLGWSK